MTKRHRKVGLWVAGFLPFILSLPLHAQQGQEGEQLREEQFLHPSGYEQSVDIDNFSAPEGYQSVELGTLGLVIEGGDGPIPVILIPGEGLSAEIFSKFLEDNSDRYTMFAVTLAGYGHTPAPSLPRDTPFEQRVWSSSVEDAIISLIEKRGLHDVVVVGHLTQGSQHALRVAKRRPDLVAKVVTLAGAPGRCFDPDCAARAEAVAEQWFKTVTHARWAQGAYSQEVFSRNPGIGWGMWRQSFSGDVFPQAQYLLEALATDSSELLNDYVTPTLVLLPDFADTAPTYAGRLFVRSWEDVDRPPNLTTQKIPDAHAMLWLDNPSATYAAIARFVGSK